MRIQAQSQFDGDREELTIKVEVTIPGTDLVQAGDTTVATKVLDGIHEAIFSLFSNLKIHGFEGTHETHTSWTP